MACAEESPQSLSRSSNGGKGSDECFLLECDPCSGADQSKEAVGYCMECQEYYCPDCLGVHRRSRLTRHHHTIEGPALADVCPTPASIKMTQCEKHTEKALEFYCESHDDLICARCVVVDHRKCNSLQLISDVCKTHEAEATVKQTLRSVKATTNELYRIQNLVRDNLSSVEDMRKKCLEDVWKMRKEINDQLDRLQQQIQQKIEDVLSKEMKSFSETEVRIKKATDLLESQGRNIASAQKTGNEEQVFIAMKKAKTQRMHSMLTEFQGLARTPNKFEFKRQSVLMEILSAVENLGEIIVFSGPQQAPQYLVDGVFSGSNQHPKFIVDGPSTQIPPRMNDAVQRRIPCNVREDSDTHVCGIRGAAFLPDDRLVVCDANNQKLKLLDDKLVLQTSLLLPAKPWDVSGISKVKVVVSMPAVMKLQYVDIVQSRMQLGTAIRIDSKCWGLATHGQDIFVCCHGYEDGEVLRVNHRGTVLQRFSGTRLDGSVMFTCPHYIAVDREAARLYVSCSQGNSVTCLTKHGRPTFTYTSTELKQPNKVILDQSGNVYVCGRDSNNIHKISAAETFQYTKMLDQSHGLQMPYAMTLRESDNALVVGMSKSDQMQVYTVY